MFAAIASSPKIPPVAQITKLQHVLPGASSRFHQALDQLENDLVSRSSMALAQRVHTPVDGLAQQMAALVMRRDLAACREKSSAGGEINVKLSPDPQEAQQASTVVPNLQSRAREKIGDSFKEDIVMEDVSEGLTLETVDAEEKKPILPDGKTVTTPAVETAVESSPRDVKTDPRDMKPDTAPVLATEKSVPMPDPVRGSHVDIVTPLEIPKEDEQSAEEKAPDTATGDMDSLFNDPIGTEDATGADAFTFDESNPNGLDFSAFNTGFDATGADNDNISSLLPGLEDYANTQTNAAADVIDFDSFFNAGGDDQNAGLDQQDSGEQRDTTFDDLMDLGTFEALDGDENNHNSNDNNAELDFDALFN